MTYLKHIIIAVLLAAGFSPTANAQSSALYPFEGATHTYQWIGLQSGDDYEFYLTADASGSVVLDDGANGQFDFIGNRTGKVGAGVSTASVPIRWNTGASASAYYLWFKVTAPGGCSNSTYIGVQPQLNAFDLLSENIPVDNTMSCPAVASTDGFNPLAPGYDAGTTMLKFIVRRVNGTDNKFTAQTGDTYDWSFQPVLSVDPAYNQGISIVSIVGVNSGKLGADVNNLYSVTGTDNEVTVTVAVKNVPGTSQDVKLMINNQGESRTNLPDSNSANDSVKHRIEVLPVIESLQGV
jgi:hypothetical protein